MREIVQMQKIREIIHTYDGVQPLQVHLKNYFRTHKEMGSRDRKMYTQLAFGYYRAKGMRAHDDGYLVSASAHELALHPFHQYWNTQLKAPPQADSAEYFPLWSHLSAAVDTTTLINSIHQQPAVWIRCKKDHVRDVLDELEKLQYTFERDGVAIRFNQNYPLQDMQAFANGWFEIQDIASQSTRALMHPQKNEAWWDCCAGSGGKSLLLLEEERQLQLFVSDSRESILHNLQDRFQRAGIRQYAAILADLSQADTKMLSGIPDMQGIIADVPCSGSGTWARTPERLSFFSAEDLQRFSALQRTILQGAIPKLLPGGKLVYLTCSVYRDENEDQVEWLRNTFGLTVQETRYFQYSASGGDTLFGALCTR